MFTLCHRYGTFTPQFITFYFIMQDSKLIILDRISQIINSLPNDWAKHCARKMEVKEGTVRAYARGERCKKNQHIELLQHLSNYQNEISKKVQKLIA